MAKGGFDIQPYIEIFNFPLSSYAVFAVFGLFAFTLYNIFRMEKYKISFFQIFLFYIFVTVFLLILSRIVYVIGKIPDEGLSWKTVKHYSIHGGIVFYGGMLGSLLGITICAIILHKDIRASLDFFTPDIPLFHCMARIGCALAGCCYGKKMSWGITNHKFPGVRLFPFQLIESACNLIIFIALIIYTKKRSSNKYCLEIYLVSYGICRFILEYFRGDKIRGIWGDGLSTSQHISLIIIFAVMLEAFILNKKSKHINN